MKVKKIIIFTQLILISISCNNSELEKNYIRRDMSEFVDLSKEDTVILFNKALNALDSIGGKSSDAVIRWQLYSENTKGVGLKHIVSFKIKDENDYVIGFYFDKDFNYLKYEKKK